MLAVAERHIQLLLLRLGELGLRDAIRIEFGRLTERRVVVMEHGGHDGHDSKRQSRQYAFIKHIHIYTYAFIKHIHIYF